MIKSGGELLFSGEILPLKRISPSRFYKMLRCLLREVLISNGIEKLLPSSPQVYFGIAAHKFLQMVGEGKVTKEVELENEWLNIITEIEHSLLVTKLERHFVPLSKSTRQYELRKRLLFNKANVLSTSKSYNTNANKTNINIEKWFETKDHIVGGYIDKIVVADSGYEIIDFKTGAIVEKKTNEVKPEYKYQLFIYAALLYENLNEWPTALKINDLTGNVYSIRYNKDDSLKVLDKAKKLFYYVNNLIFRVDNFIELQKKLANPSPENCRYCEYRPLCNTYWEVKESKPGLNWEIDIKGHFHSLTTLRNGTNLLKIKSGENTYKVRGLNPKRHEFLEGSFLSIYNLLVEENDNCFSEKMTTMIYTS